MKTELVRLQSPSTRAARLHLLVGEVKDHEAKKIVIMGSNKDGRWPVQL